MGINLTDVMRGVGAGLSTFGAEYGKALEQEEKNKRLERQMKLQEEQLKIQKDRAKREKLLFDAKQGVESLRAAIATGDPVQFGKTWSSVIGKNQGGKTLVYNPDDTEKNNGLPVFDVKFPVLNADGQQKIDPTTGQPVWQNSPGGQLAFKDNDEWLAFQVGSVRPEALISGMLNKIETPDQIERELEIMRRKAKLREQLNRENPEYAKQQELKRRGAEATIESKLASAALDRAKIGALKAGAGAKGEEKPSNVFQDFTGKQQKVPSKTVDLIQKMSENMQIKPQEAYVVHSFMTTPGKHQTAFKRAIEKYVKGEGFGKSGTVADYGMLVKTLQDRWNLPEAYIREAINEYSTYLEQVDEERDKQGPGWLSKIWDKFWHSNKPKTKPVSTGMGVGGS